MTTEGKRGTFTRYSGKMLSIIAPASGRVLTLKKETSTIIFDTVDPIRLKMFKIKLHWFYPGVGSLYRVN